MMPPSTYSQAVTFTAMVTSAGPLTPTGKVKFTTGKTNYGPAILNGSGVATLTKSNLDAGSYPLTDVIGLVKASSPDRDEDASQQDCVIGRFVTSNSNCNAE
jgi:Bacterial Ig-like domain (group 3)